LRSPSEMRWASVNIYGACHNFNEGQLVTIYGLAFVKVMMSLFRSVYLGLALVGILYLLRIARANSVVGGAREIYGS
jgi:MFS superfamily sulfate permease-like transporter